MLSEHKRRRLEQERNSLEKLYELQSEKIARIREALIVETDPSRKFQYEQQIQEEEQALQKLSDRIDEIEQQLVSPTPVISEPQKINQKILILAAIPQPYIYEVSLVVGAGCKAL
ncbi:hypothetical protein [Scytonema sp. NUACC26]|uniref:hypothetical protein n=1 Tax=Scytonema sp. NUACC26 TaxID=3140176 RepID=UPI0034DB9A8B